ncbi:serine/threonine-protein kinase [Streptomyces sp. NRRL S-87]|uniref:serine/threonine-protein kinase n=1 Tax=Streptomyces sp. NRRL S-87 TaxID=1463920 RepID=UPI0004BF85D6|nr:serine/threonine-protein kinase [Streptomyces sp. NRRL S-87]
MSDRVIAGRYQLATILGEGGMGQVWTGYDQRLDRRVAVKLLRPDKVSGGSAGSAEAEEMRRRFTRECRVTAQVDHPGLVTVHDAGSDGEDLYLVMQHVEGCDLADHLAQHSPYPWTWAVSVAAQLCGVLAAVHAVPIVHRDLKPRNVMVGPDGTVTVLDLGVASVMDTPDTTRLTQVGVPIGSPAYMAPEQALSGAVGPYTDLYALGVVLHELLSGGVPFAGATALGVLHRHLSEAPVPLRQLRPDVPPALEALVLRLLAKEPEARPGSAQEVYEALVPLLPSHGRPAEALDPTRPFLRPHAPWPDRAGSAPATSTPAAQPAPADDRPRTDIAAEVDHVRRLLDEGRLTQAADLLGNLLPVAASQHGEYSAVVRSLRKQYAATLMDDGQYRRALPELRRLAQDYAADTGTGSGQHKALRVRYEIAQCLEQLGEAAAALAEYRALLPYFENQYANSDRELPLEIRRRIGHLLLSLGDRPAARDTLGRLLFDAERLHGPHHPFAAELRNTLHWLSQVP